MTDMTPIVSALRQAQASSIGQMTDTQLGRLAWIAVHAFSMYDRDFPDDDYYAGVGALVRENVPECKHPAETIGKGGYEWDRVCDVCGEPVA